MVRVIPTYVHTRFAVSKFYTTPCRIFRLFPQEKVSTSSKRNIRRWYPQMFAQGSWYHRADHFEKNARKTLAFSGCYIRFTLGLNLRVLREQLGSISCTIKFARAFWANFQIEVPAYHGLSFFFLANAKHSCISSSFFCERRKKNERRKNIFKLYSKYPS